MSSAGGRGGMGASNTGFFFVRLKPRERARRSPPTRSSSGCGRSWRRFPGVRVFLQSPPAIQIGGRMTPQPVPAHPAEPGHRRAVPRRARELEAKMRASPAAAVDVSHRPAAQEPADQRRRSTATRPPRSGVTAQQIEDALYSRLRPAADLDDLRADQPVPGASWSCCRSTRATRSTCRCSTCARAPASSCRSTRWSRFTPGVGPLSVNHSGQLPAVTLSFNLAPGVALSARPPTRSRGWPARPCRRRSSLRFQGTAQAFQSSMQGLGLLLLLAILVIYMVLGILYESFIHPLHDPLGAAARRARGPGHAAGLRRRPQHLRLRRHHHAGRPGEEERHHDDRLRPRGAARRARRRSEAIYEACVVRFRPIMMTTMAALFGHPADRAGLRRRRRGAAAARAWPWSAACSSRSR